jgi:TolA-binding protein
MVGALLAVTALVAAYVRGAVAPAAHDAVTRATAFSAYQQGQYDEAARQFERLRGGGGATDDVALAALGRCYYEMQQWSNALAVLQMVHAGLAATGVYVETQYYLGRTYEGLDDLPHALLAYECVAAVPQPTLQTIAAGIAAARIYLDRDEPRSARDVLTNLQARVSAGTDAADEIVFWLARCALEEGDAARAQTLFAALMTTARLPAPLLPFAQCGHALSQVTLGHTTEALRVFTALTSNDIPAEVRAIALLYSGYAAAAADDRDRARSYLLNCIVAVDDADLATAPLRLVDTEGFPQADALYQLGLLAQRAQNSAAAQTYFTRCAEEYPRHPLAMRAALNAGLSALTAGAASSAVARLQQAAAGADMAARAEALLYLGENARSASNYTKAVEYFNAAVQSASNSATAAAAQFRLGLCAYDQGDFMAAQRLFEALVNTTDGPLREDAHFWSAWCLVQHGLPADAERMMHEHSLVFPTGRYAHTIELQLGRLAVAQGHFAQAIARFQHLATNTADRTCIEAATHELGLVYMQEGHFEQAITTLAKFLTDFPSSPLRDTVAFDQGLAFFSLADYTRAHGTLAALANAHPQGPLAGPAAFWAAQAAQRLGKTALCEAVLTTHWSRIVAGENAPAAWLLQGDCLRAHAQFDAAESAYRTALRGAPTSALGVEARFRLGACALARSNGVAALAAFTPLTNDHQALNRARALLAMGDARAVGGDLRAAVGDWVRVVYDYHGIATVAADAADRAARAYTSLDEPEQAQQILRAYAERTAAAQTGTNAAAAPPPIYH